MTQTLNDRRARYSATAAQTAFAVDFEIDSDADVRVWQKVLATGVITELTLTTHYTVALDGTAPSTAVATLVTGAAAGDIITVEGDTDPDRDTDFTTGGDYQATTVNAAEDRQYRIAQERKRDLDTAITINPVSPSTFSGILPDIVGKTLKYLRLNAAETALELVALVTTTAALSDTTPAAPTTSGTPGTGADISRSDHAHPKQAEAFTSLAQDTTPQLGGPLDANGQAINESEGAAVASATTTDIFGGDDGNTLHITGTTTIVDFTDASGIGQWRKIIFDGILTLTHGSGITLPGSANITTAAGDYAFVYADAVDAFTVLYFRADGTAVVSAGGGYEYIETISASTSSTITFSHTVEAGYDYIIQCVNVDNSVDLAPAHSPRVQYGTGGGPTFQTTGYLNAVIIKSLYDGVIATYNSVTAGVEIMEGYYLGGAGAGETWSAEMVIPNPAAPTVHFAMSRGVGDNASNYFLLALLGGKRTTAETITAFRVLPGTGTFVTGEFLLSRKVIA